MSIKQYFCVNIPANEQRLDPALVNEISSLTSADDDGEIVVHAEERVGLGDRHGSMQAGAVGRVDGAPANTYTSGSRPKDWISVTKIGNEPPSLSQNLLCDASWKFSSTACLFHSFLGLACRLALCVQYPRVDTGYEHALQVEVCGQRPRESPSPRRTGFQMPPFA